MYVLKRNNENVTLKLYSINPDGKTDKIKQELDIFPIEKSYQKLHICIYAFRSSMRKFSPVTHPVTESGFRAAL